jgi:hypothetical protein
MANLPMPGAGKTNQITSIACRGAPASKWWRMANSKLYAATWIRQRFSTFCNAAQPHPARAADVQIHGEATFHFFRPQLERLPGDRTQQPDRGVVNRAAGGLIAVPAGEPRVLLLGDRALRGAVLQVSQISIDRRKRATLSILSSGMVSPSLRCRSRCSDRGSAQRHAISRSDCSPSY